MSVTEAPYYYYAYSKDFDYRKYLETKSHFDRIEIRVDSGIRKLISSNEDLARSHIQEVRSVGQKIEVGFDRLSISIDAVKSSIDDLRSVCELGFGEIALGLTNIDRSIRELIRVAQTPDQTWALEQYSIAQDAFRRNLFEEAFDYIGRAIDGHGTRSGYRLEHRFYMMRGLIRLGNYKNFDVDIIDLQAAERDFSSAAKYAQHDNSVDCARSYGLAGWASYCNGALERAEEYLRKSVSISSQDGQSAFDLSKVLLNRGKEKEALLYFRKAIEHDFLYGIRAGGDPDFLRYKAGVEAVIGEYRSGLIGDLNNTVQEYRQLNVSDKMTVLAKYNVDLASEKTYLDKVESARQSMPIADLLDCKKKAPERLGEMQRKVRDLSAALQNNAKHLRAWKGEISFESGGPFLVGFVSFVLSDIYFENLYGWDTWAGYYAFNPIKMIFFLIISVVIGVGAGYVVWPIIKILMNLSEKSVKATDDSNLEREVELLSARKR